MEYIKRFFLYTFIILLVASIFKDLSLGTIIKEEDSPPDIPTVVSNSNYSVQKVKISSGDTVLSIVEEINSQKIHEIEIQQILSDFNELNPSVNPYQLQPNSFYYFPDYNKNGD
ncbi:hypothetical protein [Oceanobacillus halophilus]|uniref:LysM domain-containing protein n=1 Tax=Oceanobacillus halophilus TaxID=930130 RepID=A0A495AED1_9BACI|nr:hypothetical protein [Oceanobacillus halophilus]RKQ37804.1 hypothetical protein D8M06_03125 [Oceanobacillus halophilus]